MGKGGLGGRGVGRRGRPRRRLAPSLTRDASCSRLPASARRQARHSGAPAGGGDCRQGPALPIPALASTPSSAARPRARPARHPPETAVRADNRDARGLSPSRAPDLCSLHLTRPPTWSHPPSSHHNLPPRTPACRRRWRSGGATQRRATRRRGQTRFRSCRRESRPGKRRAVGPPRGGRPRFGGRSCRRRCPKRKGRGAALTPSTRRQPKPTKIGWLKAGDGVPVDAHAVRAEPETYAWCGTGVGSRARQPHLLSLSLPPLPLLHRTVHTTTTPPPLTT